MVDNNNSYVLAADSSGIVSGRNPNDNEGAAAIASPAQEVVM